MVANAHTPNCCKIQQLSANEHLTAHNPAQPGGFSNLYTHGTDIDICDHAMKSLLPLALLLLVSLNSVAQQPPTSPASDPYLHKGSIGNTSTPPSISSPLAALPIEKWVNQRFVFMPRTRQFQRFGYNGFLPVKSGKKKPRDYESPLGSTIPYEKYVGRTATVTAVNTVKPYGSYSDLTKLQLEFTMDDTGERLICEPGVYARVEGITPIAVLDYARAKYLNQTMWTVSGVFSTYDEDQDKTEYIHIRRYSPVKVREIVVSNMPHTNAPVRFILESEEGKRGFVDVALSGMNADPISLVDHPLSEALLANDPHREYSWSNDIWSLIEAGKVRLGMSEKQVLLSLGRPHRINRTHTVRGVSEQWVYGRYADYQYVYLTDGILTAVQN